MKRDAMQVDHDPRRMDQGKRSPDHVAAIQETYDERVRPDTHEGLPDACRSPGERGPEQQTRHYYR